MLPEPKIKGIFVNSHVAAVRKAKGDEGVKRLEVCFGKPIHFGNNQDIPVSDEVHLLECALDIMRDTPVPENERSYEAGKLHFQNFTTTPWAKLLFSMFKDFKYILLHSKSVTERVFNGVIFNSFDLGPKSLKIILDNNNYPIDHFRGLLSAWMEYYKLKGKVLAMETPEKAYEYVLEWE
jgi:uncharacterized protein (TIGR02265 family)